MILTEENYREKIDSFNKQDWQHLFDLIPGIESTSKFGQIVGDKNEGGIIQMPYWIENPLVSEFKKIVYELPLIVSFDWGSWNEGQQMLNIETFDFDTTDIPTKCKLITTIVRSDRFCDGVLISAFDSGVILNILRSIQKQINTLSF